MIANLYTIGFTKKNLRQFVSLLQGAGVDLLLDIRRHNTSQLAGYSKRDDLEYVLELLGIRYRHALYLAPSEAIFVAYKKTKELTWQDYEQAYLQELASNDVLHYLSDDLGEYKRPALLCACPTAAKCHRRLAAEWLASQLGGLEIVHLLGLEK